MTPGLGDQSSEAAPQAMQDRNRSDRGLARGVTRDLRRSLQKKRSTLARFKEVRMISKTTGSV